MPRSIDNDLAVGSNGRLMVPTQLEYVAQRARQRVRFILGESFRRPDEGIPYFTEPVIGSYIDAGNDGAIHRQRPAGQRAGNNRCANIGS